MNIEEKRQVVQEYCTTQKLTMARILKKYPVSIYKNSYSCYNGGAKQCGKCPACQERKHAFEVNQVLDPVGYAE